MQPLHSPQSYPVPVKAALAKMSPLATEIANRWMLGWPKTVAKLLESGQYLEALKSQEESERNAYSQPGNQHLARHEIADLYGLTDAPPTP